MLRGLPSVVLLLPLCGGVELCQWKFDDCVQVGEAWAMQCNVTLHLLTRSLTQCGASLQTKTVILDSMEGIKFDKYCSMFRQCAIRPTWCSWESWTKPTSRCNSVRMAKRVRRKCCHPTTAREDKRVSCDQMKKYETRRLSPLPCDEEKESLDDDRELFRDITIGCFCLLSVLLLVICCRCCRGWKSSGVELGPPRPPSPPAIPQQQPTAALPPRQPHGRVIRALQPPDVRDAPPTYLESHPLVNPSPPTYEDSRTIVNSRPPSTAVANDVVAPPPRYETPTNDVPPPPGYETSANDVPPPPRYETSATDAPPPPRYETPVIEVPPPPRYDAHVNDQASPPPGYETAITFLS